MSRVYDAFCDARDDILVALDNLDIEESMFKQLLSEQGRDTVEYIIKRKLDSVPIFFNEALESIISGGYDECR